MKDRTLNIFVDGSAKPGAGAGYGLLVVTSDYNRVVYAEAEAIRHPDLLTNTSAEIVAAIQAVQYALRNNVAAINIHHDFTGVADFAQARTSKPRDLNDRYYNLVKYAQHVGLTIHFVKIQAHSGHLYNDVVDRLAWIGRCKTNVQRASLLTTLKFPSIREELAGFLAFTKPLKKVLN